MTRRTKRQEWAIGLLALTSAAVLLSASSDRPEPQRPNLQGTWKLNEDLTARMRQDDRESGQGERQGGAPPSLAALDELTLTQQGDQVTLTDRDGNTRVLKTDNRKARDEKAPGGPMELRASWDRDGILTVEVKPDRGPKRTESYLVSNDGKHLYVTLTVDRNGREMKIRRAYDPAADEKAPEEGSEDDDREIFA